MDETLPNQGTSQYNEKFNVFDTGTMPTSTKPCKIDKRSTRLCQPIKVQNNRTSKFPMYRMPRGDFNHTNEVVVHIHPNTPMLPDNVSVTLYSDQDYVINCTQAFLQEVDIVSDVDVTDVLAYFQHERLNRTFSLDPFTKLYKLPSVGRIMDSYGNWCDEMDIYLDFDNFFFPQ